MTFTFFKKKKTIDHRMVISIMISSTIFLSTISLIIDYEFRAVRIDSFHRDVINKCLDKGWEVELYKDGQLESCKDSRGIDTNE